MITYPLIIPGPIYPSQADLKQFDGIGENLSPFDGSGEQQQFQDQHWELDLDWPEMTWGQFAAVQGLAGALHGKLGSFLWGPPLATVPRGLGPQGATPTCTGTDLKGSNILTTAGWLPNKAGVLLPGDFFQMSNPAVSVTVTTYKGTTFVANLAVLTRTNGVVSSSYASGFPGVVGEKVYTDGTNSSFDGGPFIITAIALQVDGSLKVTWNQAGVNQVSGGGGILTTDPAIVTTVTTLVSPISPFRLYQYGGFLNSSSASPLNTDAGGNATLDIFPAPHETPIAGVALVLSNPQGTFRLAENRRSAPARKTKTFTFAMKCREAF